MRVHPHPRPAKCPSAAAVNPQGTTADWSIASAAFPLKKVPCTTKSPKKSTQREIYPSNTDLKDTRRNILQALIQRGGGTVAPPPYCPHHYF